MIRTKEKPKDAQFANRNHSEMRMQISTVWAKGLSATADSKRMSVQLSDEKIQSDSLRNQRGNGFSEPKRLA